MILENLDNAIAFSVAMLLLSLVITTLVQMVASLFNLRGRHLLGGIEKLLQQLDPKLKKEARALAQEILEYSPLTPARWAAFRSWRWATAIRPAELILALKQIVDDKSAVGTAGNAGSPTSPASTDPAKKCAFDADALQALKDLFQDKVDPDSPALEAKAQELIDRFTAKLPEEQAQNLRTAVLQTFGKTTEIVVRVDAWFETVMDRTSERFKTWSRYITVGFALFFGLGLQVDSLALYHNLSTDTALRGRLLSMADSVSDQAKGLLEENANFATTTIQLVLQDPQFAAGDAKGKLGNLPLLDTEKRGEDFLNAQLAGTKDQDAFLTAYRKKYPEVVTARLGTLQKTLTDLQTKVETTTPGLLSGTAWDKAKYSDFRSWIGMLMTVAFLSLGAPFWFNALRSLSALKPVVSQKIEAQEKKTT